jgi:hypothetical protein
MIQWYIGLSMAMYNFKCLRCVVEASEKKPRFWCTSVGGIVTYCIPLSEHNPLSTVTPLSHSVKKNDKSKELVARESENRVNPSRLNSACLCFGLLYPTRTSATPHPSATVNFSFNSGSITTKLNT